MGAFSSSLQSPTMSTPVFKFGWILFAVDVARHYGILVYGVFYEYSQQGLTRISIPPGTVPISKGSPAPAFGKELGRSTRTKKQFEDWLNSVEERKYRKEDYNALRNNCIDFVIEACEFLQVQVPCVWLKIREKARLAHSVAVVGSLALVNVIIFPPIRARRRT